MPVHPGVGCPHVHRPPEREVLGLGAGAEDGGVREGVREHGALGHLLVRGERVPREAVAEACGDEDIVGLRARSTGGEGRGGGEEGGVVGVEGEEAGQEERVAGEAEGEGDRVELEADAEVGAMELEEVGDGAEEEVGGGGGGWEVDVEAGEGEEWDGEEAESRKAGEGREEGMERVITAGRGRCRRRPW